MISVSNVTMRYGSKVLFEDVSVSFIPGRRYGLTGPNGSGKTTFMKILSGELDAQKGAVVRPRKLGVLRQDQFAFDAHRVIDTVIMGNKPLWAAMEERDRIYEKPELSDADGMRLGELEGIIGDEDGYTAESDAAILLDGLDIPESLHNRLMSKLQGGQKVRVLLAQALFGKPQALLLDEPPTTSISTPYTGSRTSSPPTTAPSSPSPTTVTSSTPSPPTPPTSTTKPSLPIQVDMTRWSWPKPRSAPLSNPKTPSAKRRSPNSTTSSPASPPEPARHKLRVAAKKSSASRPTTSPAPTSPAHT